MRRKAFFVIGKKLCDWLESPSERSRDATDLKARRTEGKVTAKAVFVWNKKSPADLRQPD
jgi:hypothetical protein